MKIKVFIVTYNNDEVLANNISSLRNSDLMNHDYEIYVINNYGVMKNRYGPNVKILNNSCRADFSTGHLSRDWNTALIEGFRDLNNPDCDFVVCCHNDTVFYQNWVEYLISLHEKYTFIQFGRGCGFMSFTINAVKTIGLWDERFCNIGFHEADYFVRAMLYNREKTTLNDGWLSIDGKEDLEFRKRIDNKEVKEIPSHLIEQTACNQWRVLNPEENKIFDINYSSASSNKSAHLKSRRYHAQSSHLFESKWGKNVPAVNWYYFDDEWKKTATPLISSNIYYPFFEINMPQKTLETQKYLANFSENYARTVRGKRFY